MLRVGLTGGIGSGKSTVSRRLVEHGALLIDADVIAREVVAVGTDGLAAVRSRFGDEVLGPDGALDRPALGRIVFGDEAARTDLNTLLHPLILEETQRRFDAAPGDAIVVHDMPLLVELDRAPTYHVTVIVGAAEDVRLRRLIEDRGMTAEDARARIAAQATDAQRRAAADVWLANEGTVEDLNRRIDAVWQSRLVPFERNLRERTAAHGAMDRCGGQHTSAGADAASRLLPRVRHQLERAGLARHVMAYDRVDSSPDVDCASDCDLRITVDEPALVHRPELENALLAAGFVPVESTGPEFVGSPQRAVPYAGADPARLVTLHVRPVVE